MTTTGLIQKLCEVMMAVDHIEKKGHTSSPAGTYDFARDVDVSNALRGELAKRKVFLFSSISHVDTEVYETRNGGRGAINTVYTTHRFVDGESGEAQEISWCSQGMDGQDKGVSKAATSALKYALLKQFLIPTGEDPDEQKLKQTDLPVGQPRQQQRPNNPRPPAPAGQQREHLIKPDLTHQTQAATAEDWSLFWVKCRDMGMSSEQVREALQVTSVKNDIPYETLATILGWLETRKHADNADRVHLVPAQ